MRIADIVSDFPIIADTAERMLAATFAVRRFRWCEYIGPVSPVPSLVILDVTQIGGEQVVNVVAQLPGEAQVVVTSLDRNEVDLYLTGQSGLAPQGELPSLLDLAV